MLDWLARQPGPPIVHLEPVSLRQQQRLAWRLYRQMVPERLRTLLDTRLHALLRLQNPDARPPSTDGCYPLARQRSPVTIRERGAPVENPASLPIGA